MAIFKTPRITTSQRESLLLEVGEIVYDTDQNVFYGGNGSTLGGFLIGQGIGQVTSNITLTATDIVNKYITLTTTPITPNSVTLVPVGGIQQINGTDFEVVGNELRWDGLGLDGFLEVNDVLIVQH